MNTGAQGMGPRGCRASKHGHLLRRDLLGITSRGMVATA